MSHPHKILTLHSPIGAAVADGLLTSIEQALDRVGATHVWIDPHTGGDDLVVMAELPEPAPPAPRVPVSDRGTTSCPGSP